MAFWGALDIKIPCKFNKSFNLYENEKVWGKCQRDCIPTTKRGIYKSRGLHKAFTKGGIPFFVKSSKSPQIKKSCMRKIILVVPEYYPKFHM